MSRLQFSPINQYPRLYNTKKTFQLKCDPLIYNPSTGWYLDYVDMDNVIPIDGNLEYQFNSFKLNNT